MATYCDNDDLLLDTGREIDSIMDSDLSQQEREAQKDSSRERAYNRINSQLIGKTAIPATHIPFLKQIEIDFVIADIMSSTFSMESTNRSEWAEVYTERAQKALDDLRYCSSAGSATADPNNTGDGTVSTIVTNDNFTMTEGWTFTAMDANNFSVVGSITGRLHDLTVGSPYPDITWGSGVISDYGFEYHPSVPYSEYPITLTITAGATPFAQYDRFTFNTYSASFYRQRVGRIIPA